MNELVATYATLNRTRMTAPIAAETALRPAFQRPLPPEPVYAARVAQEFALIDRNGFTHVFLQVQVCIELCRKLKIPHIIRGSAGSSLVCYLMGISHTDPLKYDMDLTRFMNHGRKDMPDIDIDVPYNRRDELYAAIGATWPGMVARISNHVLYQYKSALQEAVRTHAPKVTYAKNTPVDVLVKDPEVAATIKADIHEKMGTLRTESLHCGGIVIFDREGRVPPDLVLKHDGLLPQLKLNKDETEDAGFIKIDILSNRGMAQWWGASGGERTLLQYPAKDDAVARVFATGTTIGITFGESRGQMHIYKKMKPTNVEDIAVALALIRPAAAAGGRKAAYLSTHRNGEVLDPIDRPIVYDDDALARIRAAFTYNKSNEFPPETLDALADQFRKAFAKQKMGECVRFKNLCRAFKVPEATLNRLVDDLHQLQHYSFCKSHALSYAQLVWALAYEKVHHPHAFWVSTLNHCNSEYRRWVHWREARHAGLRLTRGPPPYRLATCGGEPMVQSTKGEQLVLVADHVPSQQFADMKSRGYWCSKEFLPGCYWRSVPLRLGTETWRSVPSPKGTETWREEGATKGKTDETRIQFCGLIATGRVVYSETDGEESMSTGGKKARTFLCIGVDNGTYVDVAVQGAKGYLLGYVAVSGTAISKRRDGGDFLEIKTIRGVGLKGLASSAAAMKDGF